MDKQDKIYLFITGMLLLLMATFASCAKADQQEVAYTWHHSVIFPWYVEPNNE